MIRPINLVPHKARLFRSLGDEGRLAVLETLMDGEQRVTDLALQTGQAQSTISTHLAALHAAGLITREQAGRQVNYRLAGPSVLALLDAGEAAVLATFADDFTCLNPCCNP